MVKFEVDAGTMRELFWVAAQQLRFLSIRIKKLPGTVSAALHPDIMRICI